MAKGVAHVQMGRLGWLMVGLGLLVSTLLGSSPAIALGTYGTDDYPSPDRSATDCSKLFGAYSWCIDANQDGKFQDTEQWSSRSFGYKNCTDFVAYRLGLKWSDVNVGTDGNARAWKQGWIDRKRAWGTTAQVGDVAWWGDKYGGGLGHVAVVTAVAKDGTVTIEEYNHKVVGGYGTRSGVTAEAYLRTSSSTTETATTGPAGAAAAVVPTSDGHIQIFSTSNGNLTQNWYSPSDGSRGAWVQRAVPGSGVGTPAVVLRSGQTVIDIFVRGTDGQVRETWYNWANGSWGGWIGMPGATATSDPQVVRTGDGHVQVFFSSGSSLAQNWFSPATGAIGGWVFRGVPSGTAGAPGLAARPGQSVIDAFVRGTDGQIRETWYNWTNGSWGGWIGMPSLATGDDPKIVSTPNGHQQVFTTSSKSVAQNWFDWTSGATGGWVLF